MKVTTRPLRADDLGLAVACQAVYDDDLDQTIMPSYAWDEDRVRKAVGTFRKKGTQQKETRCVVAEVPIDVHIAADAIETEPWVCGLLVYDYDDDGYNVRLLAAHHTTPPEVRETLLRLVVNRAGSFDSPRVTFDVSDYDHTNLRLVRQHEWGIKLMPCAFDGFADAWHCVFTLTASRQQ